MATKRHFGPVTATIDESQKTVTFTRWAGPTEARIGKSRLTRVLEWAIRSLADYKQAGFEFDASALES
jgi:hypothetical protein